MDRAVTEKKRFLVMHDYGMGAVYAYVWAVSKEQILASFDNDKIEVFEHDPAFLRQETKARLESRQTYDIHDADLGWLEECRKLASP